MFIFYSSSLPLALHSRLIINNVDSISKSNPLSISVGNWKKENFSNFTRQEYWINSFKFVLCCDKILSWMRHKTATAELQFFSLSTFFFYILLKLDKHDKPCSFIHCLSTHLKTRQQMKVGKLSNYRHYFLLLMLKLRMTTIDDKECILSNYLYTIWINYLLWWVFWYVKESHHIKHEVSTCDRRERIVLSMNLCTWIINMNDLFFMLKSWMFHFVML